LTAPVRRVASHARHSAHVRIVGSPITDASSCLLRELAAEAHVQIIHVTSVHRSVPDQARIFYNKHVVEGKAARYKNAEVAKIVAKARTLHKQGQSKNDVQTYLIGAIEHVHGGPASVSMHIGVHIFSEIFDVAHYSGPTAGTGRHNFMTNEQASAFLAACRRRMPATIGRLGHSVELGFLLPTEFPDEKCFHFEVKQLLYDKLELPSSTRIA
jgi:hypothetical protein